MNTFSFVETHIFARPHCELLWLLFISLSLFALYNGTFFWLMRRHQDKWDEFKYVTDKNKNRAYDKLFGWGSFLAIILAVLTLVGIALFDLRSFSNIMATMDETIYIDPMILQRYDPIVIESVIEAFLATLGLGIIFVHHAFIFALFAVPFGLLLLIQPPHNIGLSLAVSFNLLTIGFNAGNWLTFFLAIAWYFIISVIFFLILSLIIPKIKPVPRQL